MVCLKKIQFLIHKFKIATKVELLSFYPEQNQKSEIPLSEIQFNKIGFFNCLNEMMTSCTLLALRRIATKFTINFNLLFFKKLKKENFFNISNPCNIITDRHTDIINH